MDIATAKEVLGKASGWGSFSYVETITKTETNGEKTVDKFFHLCVNPSGELGYYQNHKNSYIQSSNKVKLGQWNLVGIKLFREGSKSYGQIILNGEISSNFEICTDVTELDYLTVGDQENLIVNTLTSSGSLVNLSPELSMPFEICFMSFGAYNYAEKEFQAIALQKKKKENTEHITIP